MARKPAKGEEALMPEKVFSELQKAGFDNLAQLNVALLETYGDASAEMARFVAQRIQEDVSAQHALLHCRSFTDLQALQTEFIRKAIDQYQQSAARMVEIGTETLQSHLEEEMNASSG